MTEVSMNKPTVSIIVPLFNERENASTLIDRIRESMKKTGLSYEMILVDDGSSDGTFDIVKTEASKDSSILGLKFRRNYGQTTAIKAGVEYASGNICITMDGDLQHDPAALPQFIDKINEGYDLVCSYRFQRNDAIARRFPSKIANLIARLFTRLQIQDFGSTYRAYRTEIVKEIPIYGEMHRFIPVFMSMLTNKITEIPIQLGQRIRGKSKYGISRTFKVVSDLVVLLFFSGFFDRPIHIFGYISSLLGVPGLLILSWLSINKLLGFVAIMDYAPLFMLGVLLCLVATQIFTTGIVCEYLVRIYFNNDNRRPYSLAETANIEKNICR